MLKWTRVGAERRVAIVVIEPLSRRVRHATDPGTPSAQTVADFASSLGPLGRPYQFELRETQDRGGMQFRAYRVRFAATTVNLTVYVMANGQLEQFLISPAG